MKLNPDRRLASAWLAAWFAASAVVPAFAQSRIVAPVESFSAPVAPAVPVVGLGAAPAGAAGLVGASALSAPSLSAAPSAVSAAAARLSASPAVLAPSAVPATSAPARLRAAVSAAAILASPSSASLSPASVSNRHAGKAPVAVEAPAHPVRVGTAREAAVLSAIEGGVKSWGPEKASESLDQSAVRAAASDGPAPLSRAEASRSADRPAPPAAPAPGAPRAHPLLARAALFSGAALVAAAAVSFAFPALIPAAVGGVLNGSVLYSGFALMSASRFLRAPGAAVEGPKAPTEASGWFKSVKATWFEARFGADSQAALESKAGGSTWSSFRNWFMGGLRTAALWLPIALAGMVAGWGLAKPFPRFGNPDAQVGMLSFESLEKLSLGGHLLGFVASSLAAQAATLGAFDAVRALAARLGAGRAAPWIAGAAALGVSAFLITLVTTTPSVVGSLLGIEAALLWLRARSGSWLAPLAVRGLISLLSVEFARISVGMAMPAVGTLVGLPAVWTGVAVSGILFAGLAWSAKSLRPSALWSAFQGQLQRVRDFGAAWRTPRADGAPHSPWPLMKLAALWGMILYALGDVSFSGLHAVTGGVEPTPAALVQMLSSPADLVLANFLLVGFLEEFVFRRGIFKPILARVSKWKLSHPKAFWLAAVASGLIFSYAHYIDFGALLAHFGIGGSSSVASGMYAFSLGGFAARAILGVVLAWLYASSGTLLLPIFAHFLADSYEGLGLKFGFVPFLAMAAAALLVQRFWNKGATQRP